MQQKPSVDREGVRRTKNAEPLNIFLKSSSDEQLPRHIAASIMAGNARFYYGLFDTSRSPYSYENERRAAIVVRITYFFT